MPSMAKARARHKAHIQHNVLTPTAQFVRSVASFGGGASDAAEPAVFLTIGRTAEQKWWDDAKEVPCTSLRDALLTHDVRSEKDGACFIAATLHEGTRQLKYVKAVTALVYDIDGGQTLAEGIAAIEASGLRVWLYTSHSHRTTQTEVEVALYERWAAKANKPITPTAESLAQYLRENRKPRENVTLGFHNGLSWKTVPGVGNVYLADHDPVDKFRVVVLPTHPIEIAGLHVNTEKGIAECRAIYRGAGMLLGLKYDPACSDPTRLYYFPSCPQEREAEKFSREFDGSLLDWSKVERVYLDKDRATSSKASNESSKASAASEYATYDGRNLVAFLAKYPQWNVVAALGGDGDKLTGLECPFIAEHSDHKPDFAVWSPDGDKSWGINCFHTTCKENRPNGKDGVDRLPYLWKWLDNGTLTLADLESADIGGGPVPVSAGYMPDKSAIETNVAKLTPESGNAEVEAVLRDLAALNDPLFTDTTLDAIGNLTGKRRKATLQKSVKQFAKEAQVKRKKDKHEARHQAQADAGASPKMSIRGRRYGLKPYVDWSHGWAIADLIDDVLSHLQNEKGDPDGDAPEVFLSFGALSDVVARNGAVNIRELDAAALGKHLTDVTHWEQLNEEGYPHTISLPGDIPKNIVASGVAPAWPCELERVTCGPFFTADGVMVDQPGYHLEAKTLYHPSGAIEGMLLVSKEPDEDEVRSAVHWLREPFLQFPFNDKDGINDASLAHVLAMILQPFMRDMIKGNLPIYAIFKQLPDDGASLLMDAFAMIVSGERAPVSSLPKQTENEWDKFLSTAVLEGSEIINIDNVPVGVTVDNDAFAGAITSGKYRARLMAANRFVNAPYRAATCVNGNELRLSPELMKRTVIIRLDTETDNPSERAEPFRHPDLLAYVTERRGVLVWAALTIIQNWIAKGQPKWSGDPVLKKFVPYSQAIGGILEAAGIPGFMDNHGIMDADGVSEFTRSFQMLVELWAKEFKFETVPLGKLANLVAADKCPDLLSLVARNKANLPGFAFLSHGQDGWPVSLGRLFSNKLDATFSLGERDVIYRKAASHGVQQTRRMKLLVRILRDDTKTGAKYRLLPVLKHAPDGMDGSWEVDPTQWQA
jgi:hypothetical protein